MINSSRRIFARHRPADAATARIRAAVTLLLSITLVASVFFAAVPVRAAIAPGGSSIRNVASATYVPAGYSQTETASSNAVLASVQPVEALSLTADQSVVRPPLGQVTLSHLLTNTGNTPSSYTLYLVANGPGCSGAAVDLAALEIVRDSNNNGVADQGDQVIAVGAAGAIDLQPGETVPLLIRGSVPNMINGTACLVLTARTALQALTASNKDIVSIGAGPAVQLTKTASYPGNIMPGSTRIDFSVTATNTGASDATATASLANGAGAASIMVNGNPMPLFLVRDPIPAGTQYLPATLRSASLGAVRLFRYAGDSPFAFRTAEDASAIEVAIGIPVPLVRNGAMAMDFAVKVNPEQSGTILNTAFVHYGDGTAAVQTPSNTVVLQSSGARLGLAKAAGAVLLNRDATGAPDGTVTTTFTIRVRNYGTSWLYDVQATDVLEGTGASQFGTYTSAGVPGAGQYSIVPGSVRLASTPVNGVLASVNAGFTGQGNAANLFAPGAVLPVGGEVIVQFDARVNTTGHAATLYNSANGSAALVAGGPRQIADLSTNGTDPDPDGDGDPGNNAVPTPVPLAGPSLTLVKSASLPRRVSDGVYDVDYAFKVTNMGTSAAPYVRVIDNLECAFDMDRASGAISGWQLVGPVRAQAGILVPAASFTGRATCNRALLGATDAFQLPSEIALSLTDGSRALAPGQSETLALTVRVTEKPASQGSPVTLTNKAWAAAFTRNDINLPASASVAATSSTVQSLLIDPSGTVYDSVSRTPIAGATVTYSRVSCSSGPLTPLAPDEIYGGASGIYTFNSDGSMSMTTGADGAYQFYLKSPPVSGVCSYAIKVSPPAGSGYVAPSEIIAVTPGTFSTCGAIVPNPLAPQGSDPTTFYNNVSAGVRADGSVCEVVHNHVPLDPGNIRGLILAKGGSKSQVEIGDFIDYALVLTNKTGFPVHGIDFSDTLPAGFAYVPGSSRLADTAGTTGATTADPTGGKGPALAWHLPQQKVAIDGKLTLRYRVRVGVGSPKSGDAINRATAASGPLTSNLATYTVRLNGGVFSDEAFLFGKVYMACAAPGLDGHPADHPDRAIGQAGKDAPGVPGVRLFLEDGTSVVTDSEGKWSLYGLKPITHVLRIDQTTLPPGAAPELLDNRNAGDPQSRFVDLKNGELHKADFPLTGCANPAAMQDVAARHKRLAQRPDSEGEPGASARLDPNGNTVPVSDRRSLAASGGASLAAPATSQMAVAAPLISLPAGAAGGESFIAGVGSAGGSLGTLAQAQANSPKAPASAALPSANPEAGAPAGQGKKPAAASPATVTPDRTRVDSSEGDAAATATPAPDNGADLETLLPTLDKTLAFVGLRDGDALASAVSNIRVKGDAGMTFELTVNGELQPINRVGKKATLASTGVGAWEYIGVQLKPGANSLRLVARDSFGNARGTPAELRVLAPGSLATVHVDVPQRAYADGHSPVAVKVRLTDAQGLPVTARTQVTLEADGGRWVEEDLNPGEPGGQYFVSGGEGVFHLVPPTTPGNFRLRASAATVVREASLVLVPELRPMIGVGIVEGVIDLTNRGKLAVGQDAASAAFEQDLSRIGKADDHVRPGGRVAFFFKGTILGKYLLTAAADTDKSNRDRLFRDIRPDEFYPIYGDSSARGFDAQSTQKVYVRIDRDRSFLLYGDFISASSPEVRQLSQSNRSLTGVKSVVQTDAMRVTGYAANTSQRQQIEEFAGKGISGPYYLSGGGANATNSAGDFIANSEKIELLVRDRNQPNVILKTTTLERFVDYAIEPLTRRILFTQPVASLDGNLNPQSVRVTYEVESGGPKYLVAGADVQVRVANGVQLGAVATIDQTPDNHRNLEAVTALARIGKHASLSAEAVRTDSALHGVGDAERVELQYQDDKLGVGVRAARSSAGFDNPGASMTAGRNEASVRASYRASPTLELRAEGLLSEDTVTYTSAKGVTFSVQKKFGKTITAEIGARYGSATSATASLFDYGQASVYSASAGSTGNATGSAGGTADAGGELATIRGRLTASIPGLKRAQAYVEGEQGLTDGDRHTLSIGGTYGISDKTRAYGRYTLDSSLGGDYTLSSSVGRNVGVLGIESSVFGSGRAYNEYRLADSLDGRTGQDAIGLRNTFRLSKTLRLSAGVEYIHMLGDGGTSGASGTTLGQGDAVSFTSGLEYLTPRIKASGVLEGRLGQDADTWLGSGGVGYKIADDWSLLGRFVYSSSTGKGANAGTARILSREQLGIAWRPVDSNVWNALARYEHKTEVIRGGSSDILVGTISGSSFGNDALLPGTYITDVLSAHLNVNPDPGFQIMARLAAKRSIEDDGLLRSRYAAELGQIRLIHDIGDRWDLGLQGALMHGSGGAWQKSAGVELGYRVARNLWLSGGYNVIGLYDRDLSAGDYTSQGLFFRLRFKFGESDLGFKPASAPAALPDAAPSPGSGASPAPVPVTPAAASGTGGSAAPGADAPLDATAMFAPGTSALVKDRTGPLAALADRLRAKPDLRVALPASLNAGDTGAPRLRERLDALGSFLRDRGLAGQILRGEEGSDRTVLDTAVLIIEVAP